MNQFSKLARSIGANPKFVLQTNFFPPALRQNTHLKVFDASAAINAQHAQRHGHFCVSSPLSPLQGVHSLAVQRQKMKAKDITPAGTKTVDNTFQLTALRLLGHQVPK